jgi:hypothetical protein
VLLRESYRESGKVKNRTLSNLSHWPPEKVEALRALLKGEAAVPGPAEKALVEAFEVTRSLPHGHVAAVVGTLRRLGLEELLGPACRERDLVVAMVCAQVISPGSKLAFARQLRPETATSSLGEVCSATTADEDDLYGAMDWLLARQGAIEEALAARHLSDGVLVLYDVSSAAFEGRTCPLGATGHPRDGVHGRLQVVYGLLTTKDGVPVAVEVFEGNTGGPKTLASQVEKLKRRFGLSRVCLVGDRGMLTSARSREDLAPAQLDRVTALRAPQVKALLDDGTVQLSLFDETGLFEVAHPSYPGERLVACKGPLLAEERALRREELSRATEADLAKISEATRREKRPLRGKDEIALKVGRVITATRWPSTFRPRSPRPRSASPATRKRSPRRPAWTASTCCARACLKRSSAVTAWCSPTRSWRTSSGLSGASTPSSTSALSATTSKAVYGGTSSCACSATTSPGT